MSILKRFSDIMASNINALLDKMEDPAKMIDQLLRNLEDDLNKVKAETAGVMADEARAKRVLDECSSEIRKMQDYAERAVKAGNDDDARKFLTKKAQLTANEVELKKSYDLAAVNAQKMKQMHDKLVTQIQDLNSRKDSIKAKIAVAKAQERINKIGSSAANVGDSLGAFARMEQKADRMLDEAQAMAELNSSPADDLNNLMDKYEGSDSSVEDELSALKSGLGGVDDELAKLKAEAGKE
ncbi:MAG TPA: PspA/IM30 family protein [Clostridia bacterium]|nr:PspA/IM30 family protein [Clostridia bacterium]